MVRTLDANQIRKVDRPYIQPIYLVHLLLSGLTLYFSDRNLYYNGHNYEDYLFDLSGIGNEIRNLGGFDNCKVVLRFKNDKIIGKNSLIELFDDYPPEKKYVEIYKLYIDTGETFGSDVSTKVFKGEMGQPYDVCDPAVDFKIDCSMMLFGKNASLPLDVIDLADFPNADPDDVGKNRNILYGSLKKVICPWTVAGWLSTLTADITAAATSIVVSDSNGCPATPFTTLCDAEQIRVTGNTKATGTLTVTRGYGGTAAVIHNKGASIYEKRTDFEVEVAQHPVKAINNVYVKRGDGEWWRAISGFTANVNNGGRATIVFTDKVTFEQKPNQGVDTGSHAHTGSFSGNVTKTCIPTDASGGTNPLNSIDGNEGSYASMSNQALTVTFDEDDLGTVAKQYIWFMVNSTSPAVQCGGTGLGNAAAITGWQRKTKVGGSWNDNIYFFLATGYEVFEVYKEVEYNPDLNVDAHAADGVGLNGNSVANTVIGDLVACDVDGYADPDGNYGGAGNLIERPDYVRKHILVVLLGFALGDIGSSFASVGTIYANQIAGGYKFVFNLPEVAQDTMDLFMQMDLQTRSNMFESGGVFQLAFGSLSDPTSQMPFSKDNIRGRLIFSKSEVAEIRNKIRGHFFRDYSKFGAANTSTGSLGDKYQKVDEVVNSASVTKYGLMMEDVEFSCVGDLALMVDDVLAWMLIEKKELKKIVTFEAFWDAMILEFCDYFTVTSNFWSGLKFKTVSIKERPADQILEIKGLQFFAS